MNLPVTLLVASLSLLASAGWAQNSYKRVNLVADQRGEARRTDPSLVNPWGLVLRENGVVVLAENGTGRETLRTKRGRLKRAPISIPGTDGGQPTGVALNTGNDFLITDGVRSEPARIITVTGDGLIVGWNPAVNRFAAVVAVDNSEGPAVYTGVTRGRTGGLDYLYVANFGAGVVEIYDSQFQLLQTVTDPTLPAGYAPFNVRVIRDRLFVTYAKQLAPDNVVDDPGPGRGYVNIFDLAGNFVRRFAAEGVLNSPWGIARAPEDGFRRFSDKILIGNHGNGRIHAFDPQTGEFEGVLRKPNDDPLVIDGLWGLAFGVRKLGDCCLFFDLEYPTLYFSAGPGNGAHGLVGYIRGTLPDF